MLDNYTEKVVTTDPYKDGCVMFTKGGFYRFTWNLAITYATTIETLFTNANTGATDSHYHTYDKLNQNALTCTTLTTAFDLNTDTGVAMNPTDLTVKLLPYGETNHYTISQTWCASAVEGKPLKISFGVGGNDYYPYLATELNYLWVEYLRPQE